MDRPVDVQRSVIESAAHGAIRLDGGEGSAIKRFEPLAGMTVGHLRKLQAPDAEQVSRR